MTPTTVVAALGDALRAASGRPFITLYDETTGERVELSVATFDNWVCKLANLFSGDWDLEEGDLLSISLPTHWRAVAATMAAWTAGLTVSFGPSSVAKASLVRWDDLAAEVPGQPDVLVQPSPAAPGRPALVEGSGTATHADLVDRGMRMAAAIGLEDGGRLLTDLDPASESGIDAALLAPLVTGSSVVLVVGGSTERLERLAQQERVTCRHWAQASSSSSKS